MPVFHVCRQAGYVTFENYKNRHMKKQIRKILALINLEPIKSKTESTYPDMEKEFLKLAEKCLPYTMTSTERLYSVYKSTEYIIANNITGDFVECGVWKGGSAMMMIFTLLKNNITDRKIYLYDTFEGMNEPTDIDVNLHNKKAKNKYYKTLNKEKGSDWCRAEIDEVKKNIYSTAFPKENIVFVKGKVEDTIPQTIPEKIALLRLDTDWYESTKHELFDLCPLR